MIHDDSPFIRRLRNTNPLPPPHQLIAPEAWSQSLQDLEIFWSKLWWFALYKSLMRKQRTHLIISFPKGGSSIHDSLITERYGNQKSSSNLLATATLATRECPKHLFWCFLFGVLKILRDAGILGRGTPLFPQCSKIWPFCSPYEELHLIFGWVILFHTFNLFCLPNWNFAMILGVTKANPFITLTSLWQKSCTFLHLPWICQCYHPAQRSWIERLRTWKMGRCQYSTPQWKPESQIWFCGIWNGKQRNMNCYSLKVSKKFGSWVLKGHSHLVWLDGIRWMDDWDMCSSNRKCWCCFFSRW